MWPWKNGVLGSEGQKYDKDTSVIRDIVSRRMVEQHAQTTTMKKQAT